MKKLVTSAVLASALLGGAAFAESDGAFVGGTFAYSTLKSGEYKPKAYRLGIVGGYKQFFTPEFGARYYVNLDSGTKYTTGDKGSNGMQTTRTDIGLNADALYNFINDGATSYGVFGGLSLDYAMNKPKEKGGSGDSVNGLDLGINFGLRAVFAEVHGVELVTRFGLTGPKPEGSDEQVKTPANFGLRYTFSF